MANFEAFCRVISSIINLLFLKSAVLWVYENKFFLQVFLEGQKKRKSISFDLGDFVALIHFILRQFQLLLPTMIIFV